MLGVSVAAAGTAVAGNKAATIISITFDPFVVSAVDVLVPDKSVTNPKLASKTALDITITGINGVFAEHGNQVVMLEETSIVATDGREAQVSAEWAVDTIPVVAGELYTVCVTLVRIKHDGTLMPMGPETCTDFGPY